MLQRRLPGQDFAHDGHVFPHPRQRLAIGHPVPALHHLRAGDSQAQDEPPPGQVVQGHRGHGGVRWRAPVNLHDPRAQPDPRGLRADPGQRRHRVRAVGLGRPGHVVAQPLRLAHQIGVDRDPRPGIAQRQSQFHRSPCGKSGRPDPPRGAPRDRFPAARKTGAQPALFSVYWP